MAKSFCQVEGLEDFNKLIDSLTDEKFRSAALRNATKRALAPMQTALEQAAPEQAKGKTTVKIKINKISKIKVTYGKALKANKAKEIVAVVTWKDRDTHAFVGTMEYGRKKAMAKLGKGKGTLWYAWGRSTDEVIRNIGTTPPLRPFVEAVHFQMSPVVTETFQKVILEEVDKQIKRQDRRNNKAAKK